MPDKKNNNEITRRDVVTFSGLGALMAGLLGRLWGRKNYEQRRPYLRNCLKTRDGRAEWDFALPREAERGAYMKYICNERATKRQGKRPSAHSGCVGFGPALCCSGSQRPLSGILLPSRLVQGQNQRQRGSFLVFKQFLK